jgi:hypothetical protein
MLLRIGFLTALVLIGASQTIAQSTAIVQVFHINPKREARTPWNEMSNCLKDTVCSQLVSIAASQIGVPPNAVRLASVAAQVSAPPRSEETRYSIAPPSGYFVCRAYVRTQSVVPATGDRASVFSLTANRSGIAIYTWTPRRGIGKGRSWYDGFVTVVFEASGSSSANCSVTEQGQNYGCRGARGVNKGQPACSSAQL